jgi:hypothetical protein
METGANANTWGNNTNTNLETLDAFTAGYLSKSVAGSANVTLTTNNADPTAESSNKTIDLNGTLTGNIYVFIPAVESEYTIFNNTSGAFTVTVAATGHAANGIAVEQGTYGHLYCDGSANYNVKNSVSALGATEFKANVSLGDNDRLKFGTSADLLIYHNGSDSFIQDQGTGNLVLAGQDIRITNPTATESLIQADSNGEVRLYYDNVEKLNTTSTGIDVSGGATFNANVSLTGDNDYLRIGASQDLLLYHDGTNSFVEDSGTGNLVLAGANNVRMRPTGTGEDMLVANKDGSVDLYYDNNKKFETTSGGIAVTGAITATGDITAFFTSDETLKTNIANIENPMEKVSQLNGVSYNWTDEAQAKYDHLNGDKEVGVIAQQVEKVLPEMVGTRDDGTKAVRYERMCALLIECVKDLQTQVNDLKKGN